MNSKVIVRTIAIAAVALTVTSFGYVLVGARSSQDDGSLGAADPSQATVLEDGVVTWAEHEAAIRQTADCLANAGVRVELQPAAGRKPTGLGFSVANLEDGTSAEARLAECKAKHLNDIESVWVTQSQPSPPEFAQSRSWFVACMQGRGLQTVGDREAQLLAWARSTEPDIIVAWARCASEQNAIFGFVP